MKLLKFMRKHIHLILLCLVSPCYQLANENVNNVHKNAIGKNHNQVAIQNVNKIIGAHRQPAKSSPIHISPQPLVTSRKVLLNPTNSAKVQSTVIKKPPIGVIVKNDESAKKATVQSKNNETKSNTEPKSQEKFYEDEDIDDLDVKSETKKVVKSKSDSLITQNGKNNKSISKTNEGSPKSAEKIVENIKENKTIVALEKHKTQVFDYAMTSSKNTTDQVSEKETVKNMDIEKLQEPDTRNLNKTDNIPEIIDIKVNDKENDMKKGNLTVKDKDHIMTLIESKRRSDSKNTLKHNLGHHNNIPITTKLELNVDSNLMEKLTNDASDKIYIRNSNFEELREKYDIPSSEDTAIEDITDLSDNISGLLEDDMNLNKINPTANDYFKNDDTRTPKDRIWRKWKNTEIHIKANDIKDIKPNNVQEPKRDLCDCYSNIEFNPIENMANNFEPEYENVYPITMQNPTRYYLPYTSYPSCYKPKSYGYQYAPVSRYQNYLFPCL